MNLLQSFWNKLTDRVYWGTVGATRTNVGLVLGTRRTMLIDCGDAPDVGTFLADSVDREFSLTPDLAVLTHGDYDHVLGLGSLELESWAQEDFPKDFSTAEFIAAAQAIHLEPGDYPQPSHTFSLAHSLDLGEQRVELVHLDAAHSASDAIVLLPDENVVFAGDLLESSGDPFFGENCKLATWASAIQPITSAADEHTVIVPGHGALVDVVFAINQRNHLAGLWSQVEWLIAEGIKESAALARLSDDIAADFWPPLSENTLRKAIPLAYAEFAASGKRPRPRLPIVENTR